MKIEEPNSIGEVWEDEAQIEAFYEESEAGPNVTIAANQAGLVSLAKLLLFLAKDEHEEYYHVHFDRYSSLDEGFLPTSNVGLIFQKAAFQEPPNK